MPVIHMNEAGGDAPIQRTRAKLRILCANDVYKPEMFSVFKEMSDRYKASDGKTITVLPGDFIGGSLFASKHRGESMVKVVDEVGFDYVTLGNHEFDYGEARTAELIELSTTKWLGSNVRHADGRLFNKVKDTDVFELISSGRIIRVGVFGVCTEATPYLASCGDDVVFEDAIEHSQRCASSLRQTERCDVVIALTHLSIAKDKEVAERVSGIDLIIGGHDHDPVLLMHNETLITKCGQNLDYLGVVDLNIEADETGKAKVNHSFQLLSTAVMNLKRDPHIDAIIEQYSVVDSSSGGDEVLCIVGGTGGGDAVDSTECLSSLTWQLRSTETAFGCLTADAMRWHFVSRGIPCDFAIINGGFIRGDRQYLRGTPILRSHIQQEMPFPRKPALLSMKGSEVVLALEQMLAGAERPVGCFPHLSAGITVTCDIKRKPLSRVLSVCIEADGQLIDLQKEYRVAVSDFYCTQEGDGITVFTGKHILSHGTDTTGVIVAEYFSTLEYVHGIPPGRLIKSG